MRYLWLVVLACFVAVPASPLAMAVDGDILAAVVRDHGGSDDASRQGHAPGAENQPVPTTLSPTHWAPGDKELEFICPGPGGGSSRFGLSINVVYTCPRRIYDNTVGGNQGWLMGNVKLDVSEGDPNHMAFFSHHGGATDRGPEPFARAGLTHSTYPTTDMGFSWADEWTDRSSNGGQYGLTATGTLDATDHMFVAYHWADEGGDHVVRVYKGDHVSQQSRRLMQIYEESYYELAGRERGNVITEPHLVFVPEPAPVNETQNETPGPGVIGEYASTVPPEGMIVLLYHEAAADHTVASTKKSAWIDIHWTNASIGAEWNHTAAKDVVGPCREASNPVWWDDKVYFACVIDKGYDARRLARVGDVDVWSWDPQTKQARFESYTGLSGDRPRLAINAEGYFAVMTSRIDGDHDIEVKAAMGWYGRSWGAQWGGLGPRLHAAMGSQQLLGGGITAIDITDDDKTVFAIYQEWNPPAPEPNVDPNDPTAAARLDGFKKFIFTFNECEAPIAGAEFTLGTSPDVYQKDGYAVNAGAFYDVQDGLDIVHMPTGEQYAWFAVGDYGAVQFGAIRTFSGMSDQECLVQAIPIIPPPAPLPVATAVLNPATTALGATFGAAALVMVGYLLTVKRRVPFASAIKAKK